jgi:hypothetical protein
LDEATELTRKASALRPTGHPHRAVACPVSCSRHNQSGRLTLLDEAIAFLGALTLRSAVHPDRFELAYQTDNISFLEEAIALERDALALHPAGHPLHAPSCNNLVASLLRNYKHAGNNPLPVEIVALAREALAMYPEGHLHHAATCNSLANALVVRYEDIGDVSLLEEALALLNESILASPVVACDSFLILCHLHLLPGTPYFSIEAALEHLLKLSDTRLDASAILAEGVNVVLARLWAVHDMWANDQANTRTVAAMYSNIISKLPDVTGFALSPSSQLSALNFVGATGSDACIAAILARQPAQAIELLDRAHGIVWSQALHQRDPQMEGAPPELAAELAGHLRAIAAPTPPQLDDPSNLAHHQDGRHRRHARLQAILREIRASHGLERFMLGATHDVVWSQALHRRNPQIHGLPLELASERHCAEDNINTDEVHAGTEASFDLVAVPETDLVREGD